MVLWSSPCSWLCKSVMCPRPSSSCWSAKAPKDCRCVQGSPAPAGLPRSLRFGVVSKASSTCWSVEAPEELRRVQGVRDDPHLLPGSPRDPHRLQGFLRILIVLKNPHRARESPRDPHHHQGSLQASSLSRIFSRSSSSQRISGSMFSLPRLSAPGCAG